jgi:uncharacterized protein YjbI with pentapeptide repeats
MGLVEILESGRQDFLEAVSQITSDQASTQPSPSAWSVLNCIEHVIAVESRFLSWIARGANVTPHRDSDREIKLFTLIRNRETKVEAPEAVRPSGRIKSLDEGIVAFNAARDRGILFVRERGDALYSVCANHPRFGTVNGVEVMHLIDGHARRHADQIREISEVLRSARHLDPPAKPIRRNPARKSPQVGVLKRDKPDIPSELALVAHSDQALQGGDLVSFAETLTETHLKDITQHNLNIRTFRVEGSVLERIHLAGTQFGSVTWKDVRLIHCDLSNVRAHRMTLVRVELIDCRLTGFAATAVDAQDVLMQNSDMRYVQLQSSKFRACEFDSCNCEEADLRDADLSGSIVRGCNLHRADLRQAKLRDTDFRKSDVDGMLVETSDLKGAIVEPAQAMVLAGLMGLRIL